MRHCTRRKPPARTGTAGSYEFALPLLLLPPASCCAAGECRACCKSCHRCTLSDSICGSDSDYRSSRLALPSTFLCERTDLRSWCRRLGIWTSFGGLVGRSSRRFRRWCLGSSSPRWFSRGLLLDCRLRPFWIFRLGLALQVGGGEVRELICMKVCAGGVGLAWTCPV